MTVVGRLRRKGEAGMITAEFAAVLPAVVLMLGVLLNTVAIGIDQIRCVDAARAVARAVARGEPTAAAKHLAARSAPDGAQLTVGTRGDRVHARVEADVPGPFGWLMDGRDLGATAVAALEQP